MILSNYRFYFLTCESLSPNLSANFFRSGLLIYFCIWKRFSRPFRCESAMKKNKKKKMHSNYLFNLIIQSLLICQWNIKCIYLCIWFYLRKQLVASFLSVVYPSMSVPMGILDHVVMETLVVHHQLQLQEHIQNNLHYTFYYVQNHLPPIYGLRQCANNECRWGWFNVWCKNGAGRLANGFAMSCCLSLGCNRLSMSCISDGIALLSATLLLLFNWRLSISLILLLLTFVLLLIAGAPWCCWCWCVGWCCGWLLVIWYPELGIWVCCMKLCCI